MMGFFDWLRKARRPAPNDVGAAASDQARAGVATEASTVATEPRAEPHGEPHAEPSAEPHAEPSAEPKDRRTDLRQTLRLQLLSPKGGTWLANAATAPTAQTRQLAEGLFAVLLAGHGVWERVVDVDDLASWDLTPDAAWQLALDHVASEHFEPKLVQLRNVTALVLLGDGAHVAARVADLARTCLQVNAPLNPDLGTLVAVPNWHALILLPVKPGLSREAVAELAVLATKLFNYTDAVTPDIFWWRPSQLVRIDPEQPPFC